VLKNSIPKWKRTFNFRRLAEKYAPAPVAQGRHLQSAAEDRMSTTAPKPSAPTAMLESPLPREILGQLYGSMLKARLLEQRIRIAPHTGEAVLSGALQNAEQGDIVVTAGSHPVIEILCGADASTFTKPKLSTKKQPQPAVAPDTKVIAAEGAVVAAAAAGLALALRRGGSPAVALAFVSGNVTKGIAWEKATAFATSYRVPLVLIADWTQSRATRSHEGRDLSRWPLPTIAVDGRDVIAVYRVVKEATASARKGHGPTLVDCVDFVAPGTRGKDGRDPLATFQGYLKRHNAWSDDYLKLQQQLQNELGLSKRR
jgi:hypothetical protein